MVTRETIQELVYAAVDDVNAILGAGRRLAKTADTVILGPGSRLDSLGLVNLIVGVEDRVQAEYAVALTLADELMQPETTLQTLGALAGYVHRCIEARS